MTEQEILNDDDRLLRGAEVRLMLGNMPESTFYRHIANGVIPKASYLGCTPVWRLGDIREVVKSLPGKPVPTIPAAGQGNQPTPA